MNEVIENKKKSEVLAEFINTLEYGSVIMHSQIETMIDEAYGTPRYSSTVQRAKKILLKSGRCIECIKGDGYRVVQPDNVVDASMKHYKRGFKAMQKGQDILTHAPVNDMSEEGRIVFRRVYDRAVVLNAAMQGASVEMKALSEKKQHPFALDNIKHS